MRSCKHGQQLLLAFILNEEHNSSWLFTVVCAAKEHNVLRLVGHEGTGWPCSPQWAHLCIYLHLSPNGQVPLYLLYSIQCSGLESLVQEGQWALVGVMQTAEHIGWALRAVHIGRRESKVRAIVTVDASICVAYRAP